MSWTDYVQLVRSAGPFLVFAVCPITEPINNVSLAEGWLIVLN